MSKYRKLVIGTALASALVAGPAMAGEYGIGRPATPDEIAAWNLDVSPDGTGLPEGSGSVSEGESLFSEKCSTCHGEFAEGVGRWPKLAGGQDTLANADPVKTVGSYWPHLSTAWDYVHRSMPFGNAQTLSVDETYAITAYILYSNFIVDEDFVLSDKNFLDVKMPNADGFIVDNREEVEFPKFTKEPCMENCKDSVEITMHASVLDVTPGTTTEEEAAAKADGGTQTAAAETTPAAEPAPAEEAAAPETSAPDPELVAAGEKVFRRCKACHMVGEGAKNRVGPELNGIVGRQMAAVDGFRYSGALEKMGEEGKVWDSEALHAFLTKPRDYVSGTKMSFAGLRDKEDRDAVVAYLSTFE